MLHAGLDLSRKRLDYCLVDERGDRVEVGAAAPDGDTVRGWRGAWSCVTEGDNRAVPGGASDSRQSRRPLRSRQARNALLSTATGLS